jgi:hypothetical protein
MTGLPETATTATTATIPVLNMHNKDEQASISPWLRCNTCCVSLRSTTEMQIHTNDPWQYVEPIFPPQDGTNHITSTYNKKRRIASLPPISQHIFGSKLKFQLSTVEELSSDESSTDDEPEPLSWDEGENKEDGSGEDDSSEDENNGEDAQSQRMARVISHMEMQLPSGKLVGSRFTGKKRRAKRDEERAKQPAPIPPSQTQPTTLTATQARDINEFLRTERATEYRVVHRDEMGLQGITIFQHRALLCAEKRAQKQESMAVRAHEWSVNKWANVQKFDLAHDRSFSKAKGGNHKMLPR